MSHLGDRALGATVNLKFTTRLYGVPTALSGSPAVGVYKQGTTTPITDGVTLTQGYDATVGLNDVSIIASEANGFEAGSDYQVSVLSGMLGTFDQKGAVVAEFSIGLATADMIAIEGSASSASNLANSTRAIVRGVVAAGASLTSVPTSALTLAGVAASGIVANQFKNRVALFDGDTATLGLRGASAAIGANSASNTPTFTVGHLPATPAAGDRFSIL